MNTKVPDNDVEFIGGSESQRTLIRSLHSAAISGINAGLQHAQTGDQNFETWFGSADAQTVKTNLQNALNALSNRTCTYDISNAFSVRAEQGSTFIASSVSDSALTIAPWKGVFLLQTADTKTESEYAAGIAHVACRAIGLTDSYTANDQAGAEFLARWETAVSITSPKNYMYFCQSCMPS